MKRKPKLGSEQLGKEMPTAIDYYLATFGTGDWTSGAAPIASYD